MRGHAVLGVALVVVGLLVACAREPVAGGEAPPPPSGSTPSATSTPESAPPQFRMPDECTDLLTSATTAAFDAAHLDLLGGPGGVYGENYFGDPTPEERVGGITCVWGDEAAPASMVIVSVAPITPSSRSGIVAALIDNGLVESKVDGALTYARIGDEVSAPAELHVIRATSWISVVEAVGGEDRFQHATELADEVTERVYVAA